MEKVILNTVELFAGTKSFSKVAQLHYHKTLTVDNNKYLNPDVCIDIMTLPTTMFDAGKIDVLWASPPCTGFSVASIGKMWIKNNDMFIPKHETAVLGLRLLDKTISIIASTQPKIWYIENPRGIMRKVIDKIFKKYNIENYRRVTVTYCQYGDTRMKPTDIWTNDFKWNAKNPCKNGSLCHIASPRGSRTGTQGINGAKDRGVIPELLFVEIFNKWQSN